MSLLGNAAPAPASIFGKTTDHTSSLFGSSSPSSSSHRFEAPCPNASLSLFGVAKTTTSSLFGNTAQTPMLFGKTTHPTSSSFETSSLSSSPHQFEAPCSHAPASLFAATNKNTSNTSAAGLYGNAQAPLFGESKANNSTLASPPASLFGNPSPNSNMSRFEAEQSHSKVSGTGFFWGTCMREGVTKINLQSITAMKAYENFSFEELRFQDYTQSSRDGAPFNTPTPFRWFVGTPALSGSSALATATNATADPSAPQAHGTHQRQSTRRRRRIVKSRRP